MLMVKRNIDSQSFNHIFHLLLNCVHRLQFEIFNIFCEKLSMDTTWRMQTDQSLPVLVSSRNTAGLYTLTIICRLQFYFKHGIYM